MGGRCDGELPSSLMGIEFLRLTVSVDVDGEWRGGGLNHASCILFHALSHPIIIVDKQCCIPNNNISLTSRC